jgi:hypothetical protein
MDQLGSFDRFFFTLGNLRGGRTEPNWLFFFFFIIVVVRRNWILRYSKTLDTQDGVLHEEPTLYHDFLSASTFFLIYCCASGHVLLAKNIRK